MATTGAKGAEVLELDELWSFVGLPKNKRWVFWLALCRRTRQVVASYAIGNRGEATCWRLLWQRIAKGYREGVLYSDLWEIATRKSWRKTDIERWEKAKGKPTTTWSAGIGRWATVWDAL